MGCYEKTVCVTNLIDHKLVGEAFEEYQEEENGIYQKDQINIEYK